MPLAYVSVQTAILAGLRWGVVATHELAEMLIDPESSAAADTWCSIDPGSGAAVNCTFYALEIADPVQGESYRLGPLHVSDFVYRTWFEPDAAGPYDAGRHLSAPLTLASASYMSFYKSGQWQQSFTFGARSYETGALLVRP